MGAAGCDPPAPLAAAAECCWWRVSTSIGELILGRSRSVKAQGFGDGAVDLVEQVPLAKKSAEGLGRRGNGAAVAVDKTAGSEGVEWRGVGPDLGSATSVAEVERVSVYRACGFEPARSIIFSLKNNPDILILKGTICL